MRFLTVLLLVLNFQNANSQIQIDIEGGIRVGEVHSSPLPGTLRFNPSTCLFEGWNGLFWVPLSSIIEFGIVEDVDNHVYKTVKINGKEWMAQNLRVSRYNDNSFITKVIDSTSWVNTTQGAWIWYNNDFNAEIPYGKLYNWYAVNSGKLCPENWHVPTEEEWIAMRDSLMMFTRPGGALKERGLDHWDAPNSEATNLTGFTGQPGGLRSNTYEDMGTHGLWWSSTSKTVNDALTFYLYTHSGDLFDLSREKFTGASVRCVKSQN